MTSTLDDIQLTKFSDSAKANINGSSKSDMLFMSDLGGVANAGGGDDVVFGGSGSDNISGGDGADLIYAGAGDDRLSGGSGDDILIGGSGNDVFFGGTGDDIMQGGADADKFYFDSHAGNDTIVDLNFSEGDVLSFGIGTVDDMHNRGIQIGSEGDLVDFLARSDVSYSVVNDSLVISYGSAGNTLTLQNAHSFAPTLVGVASGDNINGSSLDNQIFGDSTGNLINAGGGDDTVFSGVGDGKSAGGDGADTLVGSSGDDILGGQGGNDLIFGGAGNDQISGGAGDDVLTGDAGDDTFNFKLGNGNDIITDFGNGNDKINFYDGYVPGHIVVSASSLADLHDIAVDASATITTDGNAVTIDFGTGDSLTLVGVADDWALL